MDTDMRLLDERPSTATAVSRRRFLRLALGSLGGLVVLEVTGAGLVFLQPREEAANQQGRVLAGTVDDFPPDSVTEFRDGRFFLLRASDGGFLAIYRRCPHLGCTVNWLPQTQQFYCPCHASSFDAYGDIDDAPVQRALDTFAVSIEDSQIVVDTRRLIQRTQFAPEQLTYEQRA